MKAVSNKSIRHKQIAQALLALFLLLAPYLFVYTASAQTQPPPPGANIPIDNSGGGLTSGAAQTQSTTPASPYTDASGQTNLVQQAAEQNTQGVISNVSSTLLSGSELGSYNDTYSGLKQFWSNDIVSNFFANIGQVIGRWLTELINGWVSDTVQFLTAFLRTFVLNPNIAVNGLNNNPNGAGPTSNDDISPYIRQGADTMYGIACDLLLLLFILCIWKYWVDAAWRGGVGLMGSVGRMIATAGLLLAWPTIYAFEIQITNEMIKAIYFNSSDQVVMLDAAMASAVKGGLVSGVGLLANVFAPVVGSLAGGALATGGGGIVLSTVGGIVAMAGLIIYLILGGILIAELVYILVLKAIQTALLTAQYMFAPIFIVFFATPDTESICAGFVKSFVEVSLWTFVWVGLLKIMVIVLFSDFNPWGKIVMSVGVLQLMIQVPAFMSRAQISPMSDFVGAGLVTGGLLKGANALKNTLQSRTSQGLDYMMNQRYAARGLEQSQKTHMDRLPTNTANQPLLNNIRTGPNGVPVDKNGKPILPNKPGDGTVSKPPAKALSANVLNPKGKSLQGPSSAATNALTGAAAAKATKKAALGLAVPAAAGAVMAGMGAVAKNRQAEDPNVAQKLASAQRQADQQAAAAKKELNDEAAKLAEAKPKPPAPGKPGPGDTASPKPLVSVGAPKIDPKSTLAATGKVAPVDPAQAAKASVKAAPGGRPLDMSPAEHEQSTDGQTNQLRQPVTVRPVIATPNKDLAGAGKGTTSSTTATGARPTVTTDPRTGAPVTRPGAHNLHQGAAANAATATLAARALSATAVAQGRNVDPTTAAVGEQTATGGVTPPLVPPANGAGNGGVKETPFDKYKQSFYRWVPPRNLAIDIRTAQGPTMGPSTDGRAQIVGDGKGHVNHVRFGANATPEQKALQVMAAGYAQTFSSDAEAFDAARMSAINGGEDAPRGLGERMASGFMAANGKSFKQTAVAKQRFQKSLLKHAVLGSEAYVNGQDGNHFTEYLKGRYGEMTPEQQAWGTHIFTDDSSPESGWNPRNAPATDTLLAAGIPIEAGPRAAAANPAVLKQPNWGRGPAIRGLAAYVNAQVDGKCGPDTHPMVKDALVGRIAPDVPAGEVGACLAIMLESPTIEAGERACRNIEMVQSISGLVAGGQQRDAVAAYRSMSGMVNQLNKSGGGGATVTVSSRSAGGSAGGSGGSVSLPDQSMDMSSASDQPEVRVVGNGGGQAVQRTQLDVNAQLLSSSAPGHIPAGVMHAIPPGQQRVRQMIDINVRDGGRGSLPTTHQSIDMPVDTISDSPDVRTVGGGGSSQSAVQQGFVDVDMVGGSSGGGGADSGSIANQIAASAPKSVIQQASEIIAYMHTAGFTDDQIADPRIAQTALSYQHEPSMFSTAAVTAKIMGPQEFSRATTDTVQVMIDSGWSANRIQRPDVYTAQQIHNAGQAPTPQTVQDVRMMPQYTPRPAGPKNPGLPAGWFNQSRDQGW